MKTSPERPHRPDVWSRGNPSDFDVYNGEVGGMRQRPLVMKRDAL